MSPDIVSDAVSSGEKDARNAFVHEYISATVGSAAVTAAREPLLDQVFHELSRAEEVGSTHRDAWGNWDWTFGASNRSGLLYRPHLGEAIRDACASLLVPVHWPGGSPFALCLTHDLVDTGSRVSIRRALTIIRRQVGADGWAISRVGRVVRAGMVVVRPRTAEKIPLWTAGWISRPPRVGDIGVHPSVASAVAPSLLADERRQIADLVGQPVPSTRQHFLRFDARVTPSSKLRAGVTADSTLGFNRSVSFRSGSAFPHRLWDWQTKQPMTLLEIPQHIMDGALFKSSSPEYDRRLAARHVIEMTDAVERVGGCLTLSRHADIPTPLSWDAHRDLPFEARRRGAWGCSAAQLADFWRARPTTEATKSNDRSHII